MYGRHKPLLVAMGLQDSNLSRSLNSTIVVRRRMLRCIVIFLTRLVKRMTVFVEALRRAGRLWWHNLVHVTVLNCFWFLLQIPIVTGLPATAALFNVTYRLAEGDHVTPADLWSTTRQ